MACRRSELKVKSKHKEKNVPNDRSKSMYIVTIDIEKCKGCGDCVENCSMQVLSLVEEDGKMVATFDGDPSECIGCLSCEASCQEGAIVVTEY
jgi:NAD-dependent dihydropyrimidine dehydrogenase PreA subunit